MIKNRLLLFFFAFLYISLSTQGQHKDKPIAFRHLTIEQGLSQNTIISIAQDSIGYLWFATQTGLNKYNGKSFTHYNKQFQNVTRPNYSRLGKVYVDKQNQLWIVTNLGKLEIYHPKTDRFSPIKTTFNVSTIFQDKHLNTYLGTYNNGIYKINAKTKDTLQILKGKDAKLTSNCFLEVDNLIYAATSKGVLEITNNSYHSVKTSNLKEIYASSLAVSTSKSIWLGTYGYGLYYKKQNDSDFSKFTGFGNSQLPENLNIEALLVDSQERLWVATYGNGLYVIDFKLKLIQQFKSQKSNPFAIQYNDILCLFEDSTGNTWLGTDGAGASYFDKHLVKFNLLTNNQLPTNVTVEVTRSITTDNNNNIWIGTSGQGLTFIDLKEENHITYTTENSKIASNRIVSLTNINNDLWIGHQDSGLQIRSASGDYQSFLEISNLTIWKILPYNNDQVWLATENSGVILFSKTKGVLKQFNLSNSTLSSNNIRAIIKSNEHTLWLGTHNDGLFKLNTNTSEITKINSVNDGVKSLFYKDNVLWIGTNGNGLKRLDLSTNKINTYTKEDGLPNQVVYGILPDKDDNLWLSTNYGLCKFNLNVNETVSVENYTNKNGLQGLEFNTGAYFKDNNDILYFGGLEGINWFKPHLITKNNIEPQTVITGINVFNKPVDFSEQLRLDSNKNTLTFTFSGLHFSQPERNLYKYKLVNNDLDWTEAGNNNVAHYTNLPPNSYTFQVYSSNYDGVWDKTPAEYSFTILKPWYATNFAKVIYLLLIGLISYFTYRYLKFRWELKTQLQLEHAERERLKKLDVFKTKLYTNISHEIRTPLTLISGPIEQQLEKSHLLKKDRKELEIVKHNADRLLDLANQMLDLSIVESGQYRLKVSKGNLGIILKQLVTSFQFKAKDKNINFKSKIENITKVYFDKDIIEKVMSNLLSNAIKYTPDNGEILVSATVLNNTLILSVINNYDKLKLKDLGKLFQRFYQEDETTDGIGVGLALVKELVNTSKGTIIANNVESDKIQFTVTIPISKEAFTASELVAVKQKKLVSIKPFKAVPSKTKSNELPLLLIVEDEQDIRNFIKSIFTENYRIIEAQNGEDGVNLANKKLPDVIISDIMMPIKDGISLCNDLKYDKITSHIPIILLTAKVGKEHEISGLKTGADAYITKPFNSKLLQTRVSQLINNRKQLKQHYYNKGFNIKPELAITPTETEFLKHLQLILETHIIESNFTSERFAELLQMSRSQLHRKLKAITDQSTSEFIRLQRLKLAEKLLKKSDANVSEIAYQIGFNSPSYFTKCFKEHYGCTPNNFLKNL